MTLRQLLELPWRWGNTRGFGVQSATDYSFIQDVVNERRPYYAYADLEERYPELSAAERKKGELFLRIANKTRPERAIVVHNKRKDAYEAYVAAGCRRCAFREEGATIIISDAEEEHMPILQDFIRNSPSGAVAIIDGIDGKEERRRWKALAGEERAIIVYDLYSLGIINLDQSRYREQYMLNF